jgi:hypothetical protein
MKIFSILLLALVGTLIINGPIQSYADPQLDALLQIAEKARDNLRVNISQIDNAPDEITTLFKQGSNETDALSKAIDKKDIVSARQHFLSAMKFFKTTNDKISSLNVTSNNNTQQTDVLQLKAEIRRLTDVVKTLQTVALTNNINFDFTPFDKLVQQASQDMDAGKINEASKLIETANQFVIDAHNSIADFAKQRSTDRAKDFTEKQINILDKMPNLNNSQNIAPTPKITSSTNDNSTTSVENPKDMAVKLKKLISQGKVDEAIKVLKDFNSKKRN